MVNLLNGGDWFSDAVKYVKNMFEQDFCEAIKIGSLHKVIQLEVEIHHSTKLLLKTKHVPVT